MAHVDLPKQNKACGLVLHGKSNAFIKGSAEGYAPSPQPVDKKRGPS